MNANENMLSEIGLEEAKKKIDALEKRLNAANDVAKYHINEIKSIQETILKFSDERDEARAEVEELGAIRDALTAEGIRLAKERDAFRRLANAYRNAAETLVCIDGLRRAELESKTKN